MFLVVGLGNPGEEYAETPHNAGFKVVDRLAEMYGIRVNRKDSMARIGIGEIAGKPVMLAQPQTFMNLSGMDYLLAPVKRSQKQEWEELIGRGAEAVATIISEGAAKAMTIFNRRAQ